MANTTGTAGGVGSPQGGQQGWDDAENAQPIPPSREGTTSAGGFDMAKAKTDAEQRAEDEAKAAKSAEGLQATTQSTTTGPVITDPGEQENFGLPDGVSTSATRGENKDAEGETVEPNPEGEPNPTVEEQLGTAPEGVTEAEPGPG